VRIPALKGRPKLNSRYAAAEVQFQKLGSSERTVIRRKLMRSPCSECGGTVKRKAIKQEFEREGVKVRLSGFKTWICTQCDEIYFEPGGADKMAQAVNCLFELILAERQHKGVVNVSVS
jgi:YgiT-type zinc finger domain-containing protein